MPRIIKISRVKPGSFFALPDIYDLSNNNLSLSGRTIFVRGNYDRSTRKYFFTSCADFTFCGKLPCNTLVLVK